MGELFGILLAVQGTVMLPICDNLKAELWLFRALDISCSRQL